MSGDKKKAAAVAVVPAAAPGTDVALVEQDARVKALATRLRYEGSTTPDVLENSAREAIRRIGMGIFELGGYLLLLREACPHGQFMPTLDRLGLEPRAAQRYMEVTKRFSANASTSTHLEALGMSKLVELLPLGDDQAEELLLIGQTGELALDDVATMSVAQLRAAVREEREERKAQEEVSAEKDKRIDKLKMQLKRIKAAPPDQELVELKKEAAAIAADAEGAILGGLREALVAITDHAAAQGQQGHHDVFLAGLVGQVQDTLTRVRHQFNLPDVSAAAAAEAAWLQGEAAAGTAPAAQG